MRVGSENMENLMTVIDRLDKLQVSSVGRRECSSTRQRKGARRMDVHVDTYSQPCPRATGCGAALCIRRTLRRHVTIGTPMVIFLLFDCISTVFDDGTLLVQFW